MNHKLRFELCGGQPLEASLKLNDEKTKIITSKGVELDVKEVLPFLKAIKNKEVKKGMKVSVYTVVDISSDYIQVSCHKIPIKEFEILIERLGL